jgi:hypothetical protein
MSIARWSAGSLLLGLALGLLGPRLMQERVDVLVTTRSLARGDAIAEGDLAERAWPRQRWTSGMITAPLRADVVGQEVAFTVHAGEPVLTYHLASAEPARPKPPPAVHTWWDRRGRLTGAGPFVDGQTAAVQAWVDGGWTTLVRHASARRAPAAEHSPEGGPPPGTFGLTLTGEARDAIEQADADLRVVEPWMCDLPAVPTDRRSP